MVANPSELGPLKPTSGTNEEYHPYGTTAWWAGTSDTEVSAKRYRYTGKEKDEETGLYYHGARYYAPWLGRWVSADPIGLKAGINRFAYCSGRPVSHADPDGHEEVEEATAPPATDAIRSTSGTGPLLNAVLSPAIDYWLEHSWQGAALQLFAEAHPSATREVAETLEKVSQNEVVLASEDAPVVAGSMSLVRAGAAMLRRAAARGITRGLVLELSEGAVVYLDDVLAMASVRSKGPGPARPEHLAKLLEEARAAGVDIISDQDAVAFLDHAAKLQGRNPADVVAVTLDKNTVLVRPEWAGDVRTLREELIHAAQQGAGRVVASAGGGNATQLEIEAREIILANTKEWGITEAEVEEIHAELAAMRRTGKY